MLKKFVSGIVMALTLLCTFNLTFGHEKGTLAALPSAGSRLYLDPSSYTFDSSTATVGTLFNVTLKLNDVVDMQAWQVRMAFNDSIINATCWYEPEWDPTYVFYGNMTNEVPASGGEPKYYHTGPNSAYLAAGAMLVSDPGPGGGFTGEGLLGIFTFNITIRRFKIQDKFCLCS